MERTSADVKHLGLIVIVFIPVIVILLGLGFQAGTTQSAAVIQLLQVSTAFIFNALIQRYELLGILFIFGNTSSRSSR